MPQNFIESSRDQSFLLAPSLRDWLPEDHLAWFVIQTVDEVVLVRGAFTGRPPHSAGSRGRSAIPRARVVGVDGPPRSAGARRPPTARLNRHKSADLLGIRV